MGWDERKLPPEILNQPELQPGLEFFFRCYQDLCTCRQQGLSSGEIPVTAVIEYARFLELDVETTHDLVRIIRAMDQTHLEWEERKAKARKGKK